MASTFTDRKGDPVVQFVAADGRRRSISLAGEKKRTVETVKHHVEELSAAQKAARAPYDATSEWVARIGVQLHNKLARAGLVPEREAIEDAELKAFLDDYTANRGDVEPNTIRNFKDACRRLVDHFGASMQLSSIRPGDADNWRQAMANAGFAEATISKAVKHAKQFFRLAERKGLVERNPFNELKAGERNRARLCFVERATIDKVIAEAPDPQWRLIIALSRYGGLRCPSEHLALRWSDVDWVTNRIAVPSPNAQTQQGVSNDAAVPRIAAVP